MIATSEYQNFLGTKIIALPDSGTALAPGQINPILFPFQAKLTEWALRKGRAAIWADCGLGKTFMQLEWARLTGQQTLIVAPLAVTDQTIEEGRKLGIDVAYARSMSDVKGLVTTTNYEMVDKFDPAAFGAVVLDESSILKSVGGKTRTKLIRMFSKTQYRLCCTATPAPNDIAEFANHAEFLGICTREEMLSMFFVHDDDGWRLKGHAREPFYRWMASWGMMVKLPSDIGFPDDGYELPGLEISPEWIDSDSLEIAHHMGQLFPTRLSGIQGRSAVRRATVEPKTIEASRILNSSPDQWIVWVGLNDEGRLLKKRVPDATLIEGADSLAVKMAAIRGFVSGEIRVLITKVSISGFGLNLQHCQHMMFVGLNDSYEAWYQAIRRCWRFGQDQTVDVRVILSRAEAPIWENVMRKEAVAEQSGRHLVENVTEYEKLELSPASTSMDGYRTDTFAGDDWTMLLGDCIERLAELELESVDFSVFSPPFLSLYVYSHSERDLGNSSSTDAFFAHYDFMLRELYRVMKPGRIVATHVAQVPATLVNDGFIGIKDFRGGVIDQTARAGFHYHGDICIDKDPQVQAIRTHSKALLFKQLRKDASWLRPGLADYILLFRKPGESEVPITPDIDNETWIKWARPIWYDIREAGTLHVAEARAEKDERHIAPLQLGTIERCIALWSNKGDTVLSPFAGMGSEGYQAILQERRFVGIELKREYYDAACRNLQRATERKSQQRLL